MHIRFVNPKNGDAVKRTNQLLKQLIQHILKGLGEPRTTPIRIAVCLAKSLNYDLLNRAKISPTRQGSSVNFGQVKYQFVTTIACGPFSHLEINST